MPHGKKWSKYNYNVEVDGKLVIFNGLYRHLLVIDKKTFKEIDNILTNTLTNNKGFDDKLREKIEYLTRLNIIIDDYIDEALMAKFLINRWKYTTGVFSLFISYTSACNLSCRYCYQDNSKNSSYLSEKKWNILYDFIESKISRDDTKSLSIALFGGEPLLNYKVLLKSVKDIKSLEHIGVSSDITLITNGTLLNKNIAEELFPYMDAFQITIDGTKESHDRLRPYKNGFGTYDVILSNLIENLEELENKVQIRSNIDESNYQDVIKLLDELSSLGLQDRIRSYDAVAIYASQKMVKSKGFEHLITPNKVKLVIEVLKYATKKGFKISKGFVNALCIGSLMNGFAVDENLNIYKCPGFYYDIPDGYIDHNGKLIITNNRFYKFVLEESACFGTCEFAPICYGGCKWMRGSKKIHCPKPVFIPYLSELIKYYAISNYPEEIR